MSLSIVKDRVKETSTTTGTGAFTLAGAMTGFQAFSAVCATGDFVYYTIQAVDAGGNPTGDWEVGYGNYSAANTLTRTVVQASSNANAAVNFAAGTKQVWLNFPANQARMISTNNPPLASRFTIVNGPSATKTDKQGRLMLVIPPVSFITSFVEAYPATPFTLTIGFRRILFMTGTYNSLGLGVKNSTTNNLRFMNYFYQSSSGVAQLSLDIWTSEGAFSSRSNLGTSFPQEYTYFRITDNGTTRTYLTSSNMLDWDVATSEASTTGSPNQIGLFQNTNNSYSTNNIVTYYNLVPAILGDEA